MPLKLESFLVFFKFFSNFYFWLGIRRLVSLDRNDARFRAALTKQGKDAMDLS